MALFPCLLNKRSVLHFHFTWGLQRTWPALRDPSQLYSRAAHPGSPWEGAGVRSSKPEASVTYHGEPRVGTPRSQHPRGQHHCPRQTTPLLSYEPSWVGPIVPTVKSEWVRLGSKRASLQNHAYWLSNSSSQKAFFPLFASKIMLNEQCWNTSKNGMMTWHIYGF